MVSTINFQIRAKKKPYSHRYAGSAIRGVLGHALKKMNCMVDNISCDQCTFRDHCLYYAMFEKTNPGMLKEGFLYDTRPYLLYFPSQENPFIIKFSITLLGGVTREAPRIIAAVKEMASIGLGVKKLPYTLERAVNSSGDIIYENNILNASAIELQDLCTKTDEFVLDFQENDGKSLLIDFLSPVSLRAKVGMQKENYSKYFLDAVLRRHQNVLRLYSEKKKGKGHGKTEMKGELIQYQLTPVKVDRYSNRQKQKTYMAGYMGSLILKDINYDTYRLIRSMEYLHIGRYIPFGFGKIKTSWLT